MNSIILNRQRLIKCRKELGITKQEAAKRMNLSQPAYLRYESGERTPSIHVIQIMANVLGTSVDYLTDKTDIPSPNSYTIESKIDPELFHFIEMYKTLDNHAQNRLIAYMKKLNDGI